MDITKRLLFTLERDEGKRAKPYRDTVGLLTVGIGRNIQERGIALTELSWLIDSTVVTTDVLLRVLTSDGVRLTGARVLFTDELQFEALFPGGLSDDACYALLETDVQDCVADAHTLFGEDVFDSFSLPRQEVVVNLIFNLGSGTFRKFKKAIAAMNVAAWQEAAAQILDSRAARQTGQRYHRLANVLRTNDPAGFEVDDE